MWKEWLACYRLEETSEVENEGWACKKGAILKGKEESIGCHGRWLVEVVPQCPHREGGGECCPDGACAAPAEWACF